MVVFSPSEWEERLDGMYSVDIVLALLLFGLY